MCVISRLLEWTGKYEKPRIVFYCIALVLFAVLMSIAPQVGITGDEPLDAANGKYCLEYYTHGDTSFADYSKVPAVKIPHMKYYGVGFEILPAFIVKYWGMGTQEYLIRHLLNAIFGFLFMLFAGLIAKEVKNWRLACITLLVMGISPIVFGLSFFDSKDIPMAAGFAIAIYAFFRIYKTLPKFNKMDVMWAVFGIALAVSIRVGGLLLPFYFGVGGLLCLYFRPDLRNLFVRKEYAVCGRIFGIGILIIVAGCLLGFCAYPNFFYEGPVGHIKHAFQLVKEFKQQIPMLYKGEIITSLNLPPFYLWKSYLITIPFFAWLGVILFLFHFPRIWNSYNKVCVIFLLFTLVFPPLYIGLGDSNIYNGWRHTLFIFSSFAAISAVGMYETYESLHRKSWKKIYLVVMLTVTLPTVFWMCRNYKYCYSYYNPLIAEPYLNYDMDYYETACVNSFEWLMKNVVSKSDSLVRVGAKNISVVAYQNARRYKNVDVKLCAFRGYAESDFDYQILSLQFIPAKVLKTFFPPKGTIHVETIEGKPVCAVVKKENHYDADGIRSVRLGKIEEGMDLLEKSYRYNPANFGIWFWMGYGYYYQKKYKKSIELLGKYVYFWPSSGEQIEIAFIFSGLSFLQLKLFDQAIQTLKQAERMTKSPENQLLIYANLGRAYYYEQNYKAALPYLKQSVQKYPDLKEILYDCSLKSGDKLQAEKD